MEVELEISFIYSDALTIKPVSIAKVDFKTSKLMTTTIDPNNTLVFVNFDFGSYWYPAMQLV